MSSQPYSPTTEPQKPKPDLRRALLALVVLVLAAGGLLLLAQTYGHSGTAGNSGGAGTPLVNGSIATSTPEQTAASVAQSSPQRPSGVGVALPLTSTPTATASPTPTSTDTPLPPTATETPTETPTATATSTPLAPDLQTLQTLDADVVPARDSYSLTARLKLKQAVQLPRTSDSPAGNYSVGHSDIFNISDSQDRNYYTITATVRQVTAHAYWYVQNGQAYDNTALKRLSDAFENKIYPTDRSIFGSEWLPGVDNDPRITILFTPLRGAGGSYSAADEFTTAVNPFSNEREIIYISTGAGWGGLETTLAHEFQHMIHWHEHPNQDIWLNEGSSQLASALNGYDVQGTDGDFMRSPGTQLNAWQSNPTAARPNYGASLLFLDFLRGHFGGNPIIKAVINASQPSTDAVDAALASLGYKQSFADVFKQWTIANLVSGYPGVSSAYTYTDRVVQVSPQVQLDHYPTGSSGQIAQFGATYVELSPQAKGGTLHVDFSGQRDTRVIGAPAHGGQNIYWSNRGDLSDSYMTRSFDLSGTASATLNLYLWYDIETDFDHAYIEASTDGGVTWNTLKGNYTTNNNPNGTNYGNAYTGSSKDKTGADANGWIHERIDLGAYAGKQILLRAEYITDDSYNAQGFAMDDLSIPEIGYTDGAEADAGWQSGGFVRVADILPQTYYMAVVLFKQSGVDIQPVDLDASNKASFDVSGFGGSGPYKRAVLVISGMTTHNIQTTSYDLSVRPAP